MGVRSGCRAGLVLIAAGGWLACQPPDNGAFGYGQRFDSAPAVAARPDGGAVDAAPDAPVPQPAPGNVEAPWRAWLVGNPEGGGSAEQAAGAFTVKGSGRDLFNTLGFTLVAQPFAGDGEIVAHVSALAGDGLGAGAKAGVILLGEEALTSPAAAWAGTFVTPGAGAAGQWRDSGAMTATSEGAGVEVLPGWVRLSKVGPVVSFSYSPDGALWISFGSATLNGFGPSLLLGLAVSAKDDATGARLATATFDSVTITRYPPGQAPDAGAPGPVGPGIAPTDGPLPGGPLPAPWTFANLGTTLPGSASEQDGTFYLAGGGRDIWARADNGAFVYQRVSGDAEIQAEVLGVQPTNQHAKAGLMVRASLDADDLNAMWLGKPIDPGPGLRVFGLSFQWRPLRADNSKAQDQHFLFPPQTMRLARRGSTLEASVLIAPDRWWLVARQTLDLPEIVYVGLAVTAHDPNLVATGLFRNVSLSGQTLPPLPDAGAPPDGGN
jgi:hypothetical protein